jgi:DNA-binding response OmpR family regulator
MNDTGKNAPAPMERARADAVMRRTPIVVITASDEDRERIVRLLGLTFDNLACDGHVPEQNLIRVGPLTIDKGAHRVDVDREEIPLTKLEFRLLVTLVERRDCVQTREMLLSDVWAANSKNRTRTLDTHVARLRRKLRGAGRFIKSIRGVGYRFSDSASEDGASAKRAQPLRISLTPPSGLSSASRQRLVPEIRRSAAGQNPSVAP